MRTVFDLEKKRERFKVLEREIQDPTIWKDKEKAVKTSKEFNKLKEETGSFDILKIQVEDLKTEQDIAEFRDGLKHKEVQIYLSGEYDKGNAILSIYAGAGGHDAQDWAAMLLKLYEKYCQAQDFKAKILSRSFGDGVGPENRIGIKSVELEVKGRFAYGFLRGENGVHRLVRLSPFSTKSIRHTSFALVEVLPEIKEISKVGIDIKPEDIKIDTYRASGPGGQYVNKRETAIRVTHLPTNITASCQSERSQAQNKEKAIEVLRSRLYKVYKEKRNKEISEIKGGKVNVSWGNQIRSYVLHPYKLVKDLRTGVETNDVESVLNGQINEFIESEVKIKSD